MGHYTEYTTRWLDRRYAQRDGSGRYFAHMPIYGLHHPCSEPNHAVRLARLFQLLRELDRCDFASCLDVGGGEGFLSHVVRGVFGTRVVSCDLSVEACRRAWDLFRVDAVAIDSARLPFPDDSFDVVVCSEVVEHVEFAVECLLELARVARHTVILSTEELEPDRAAIEAHLFKRCGYPHYERNLLHPDDLRVLFGEGIAMRSQLRGAPPAGEPGREAVEAWIRAATAVDELAPDGLGVIVRCDVAAAAPRAAPGRSDDAGGRSDDAPRRTDDELLAAILDRSAVADAPLEVIDRTHADPDLIARCVCPFTGAKLAAQGSGLVTPAGRGYAVRGGVPVLYDLTAADPTPQELRERLVPLWPGEPDRAAAALALRAALVVPFDPAKSSWDFAEHEDRRGWLPAESMVVREPDADCFAFRATDDDPWFASPGLCLAANDVAALTIRMRTHNPEYPIDAGVGQVFWMTDDDTTLAEDRCITFPVRNEDAVHDYRIEPRTAANWPRGKRILFLRIDPANGPGDIDLHRVAIETR